MRAYVLSIGSELIGGHLTDTNATFLAQELTARGIELLHVIQVGDDLDRLTRTLAFAVAEADLVICTGGIGPTDDDLTREAIAALIGETPTADEEIVASIREFFAQRGLEMPERNAKQAWTIPSAEVLPNPSAPRRAGSRASARRWSWPCPAYRAKCSACGASKRCRVFPRGLRDGSTGRPTCAHWVLVSRPSPISSTS
jgi:molybdenum cofactor synthesis domain-containing protein